MTRMRMALLAPAFMSATLGFSAAAGAKTEMEAWFQGIPEEVKAITARIDAFNKMQDDVFVRATVVPHDGYSEKVKAAASAGALPDVMEVDSPYLSNYVWSGLLAPIGDYLAKATIDGLTPSNLSSGTSPIDRKLYGVGQIDANVVLYGNRVYLEKIGARIPKGVDDAWTREEFEDYLEKLSKLDGVSWPLDLLQNYGVGEWYTFGYSPIFWSFGNGCDLIDRRTWKAEGTLNSQSCVDAATMMQGWFKKGWIVPASSGFNQIYAPERKAALAWGGNWYWPDIKKGLGDDLVVMPLPKFGEKGASPEGAWLWTVTRNAKDKEAAGRLVDFLLGQDLLLSFADDHGMIPGVKAARSQSKLYGATGGLAIVSEQLDNSAVPRPQHPAYPAITASFYSALDNIFRGADSKKELDAAAAKIDADIEDNDFYPPFGGQ